METPTVDRTCAKILPAPRPLLERLGHAISLSPGPERDRIAAEIKDLPFPEGREVDAA